MAFLDYSGLIKFLNKLKALFVEGPASSTDARIALFDGTTGKKLKVSSYSAGAAAAKGVTDNSAAAAVASDDTNLITGRTLYYAGYAPTVSPALTGTPTAPTAASGTNTTQIATTAFVKTALDGFTGGSTVTAKSVTIAANAWSSGTATVTVQGVTTNNNILVGMGGNLTADQENAVLLGELVCTAQGTDQITIKAFGTTPTVAIPINVFIFD